MLTYMQTLEIDTFTLFNYKIYVTGKNVYAVI